MILFALLACSGPDRGPALSAACDVGEDGLCFDCHLCVADGVPPLRLQHYVCVDCHSGDTGGVPSDVEGSCGCDTLDCSTSPPTLDCKVCHTPSSRAYPSQQYMNGLCTECHAPGAR